jgi:SAM-dependent methyltransferase
MRGAGPEPAPGGSSRDYWEQRLGQHPHLAGVGSLACGLPLNRWLYRVRSHRFRAVVRRLGIDAARQRILDVGSGTGFYLEQWKRLGAGAVDGLDFATTAVSELRAAHPESRIYRCDLGDRESALPSDAYDVVSAFDVLFHIVDDGRYATALHHLARVLRPGGLLLYSDNFVHRPRPPAGSYHFSRTLETIGRELDRAGFDLLWRVPMFVLLNAPDDTSSRALHGWWRLVSAATRRHEALGLLIGAAAFPLELVLTGMLRESPSTEIAACRKRSAPTK